MSSAKLLALRGGPTADYSGERFRAVPQPAGLRSQSNSVNGTFSASQSNPNATDLAESDQEDAESAQ